MFPLMNYTQIGWVSVLAKQKAIINSNKKHAPHSALASILFLEKRKGEKRVKYGTYILWKGWQTTHTKMGLLFRR